MDENSQLDTGGPIGALTANHLAARILFLHPCIECRLGGWRKNKVAPTSWEDWTHSTINGVDVWTYDYGSGTATVSGLDEAAFQQLTFALGLPEGFA